MRFFVTGGTGFIGSHLVDRLVNTGSVTVYGNLSARIKEFIEHHLDKDGFAFIQADLLGFDILREYMASHDVVCYVVANPEARRSIQNTWLDLEQETIADLRFTRETVRQFINDAAKATKAMKRKR